MSAYQGKRTFNKYPYSHNQLSADNPFRYMGMGVSYNPYLPKVSNPPEKYESNQSSSPYEKKDRPYNRNSSASLINNSYNIINNNGSYNKNRNFASPSSSSSSSPSFSKVSGISIPNPPKIACKTA